MSENSRGDCVTSGEERGKCNENISSKPFSSSVLNLYVSCFLLLGYFRVWGDFKIVEILGRWRVSAVEEWRCLVQDKTMINSSEGLLVSAELNSPFQSYNINGTHNSIQECWWTPTWEALVEGLVICAHGQGKRQVPAGRASHTPSGPIPSFPRWGKWAPKNLKGVSQGHSAGLLWESRPDFLVWLSALHCLASWH